MSSAFLKPILLLTAISFCYAQLTDTDFDQIVSNLRKALNTVDKRKLQFPLLCNPSQYPTETAILIQNLSAPLLALLPDLPSTVCQNATIKSIAAKLLYLNPETVVRYALCSFPAASTKTTRCRLVSWGDIQATQMRDALNGFISITISQDGWMQTNDAVKITPYAVCTNPMYQQIMPYYGSTFDQLMTEFIFSPPCTQLTASKSTITNATEFMYNYICTLPTAATNSPICQTYLMG